MWSRKNSIGPANNRYLLHKNQSRIKDYRNCCWEEKKKEKEAEEDREMWNWQRQAAETSVKHHDCVDDFVCEDAFASDK